MSLCGEHSLVNANNVEGVISSLKCKRWSCDECAQANRHRVMHHARCGRPNMFLTLTCDPKRHADPDSAAREMKRGLVALRRRIERRWKVKNIPFIVVYEKTKKGWPHMHLLLRAPFMHWKVLRAMWEDITGAFEVDVRFIKKASQVLFYVTKYIGKDLHAFAGCKRWWRSHNYEDLHEQPPERVRYSHQPLRIDHSAQRMLKAMEKSCYIIRQTGRNAWHFEAPFWRSHIPYDRALTDAEHRLWKTERK